MGRDSGFRLADMPISARTGLSGTAAEPARPRVGADDCGAADSRAGAGRARAGGVVLRRDMWPRPARPRGRRLGRGAIRT